MSQLQREKCVTGWWAIGMSYLCTPGMTSNLRLANASTFNTLLHDVAWCYMPLLTVGIVSRTVFFRSKWQQLTAAHRITAWYGWTNRSLRHWRGNQPPGLKLGSPPLRTQRTPRTRRTYQSLPKITKHTKTKKATWSATWMPHERHRSFLED